MDTRRILAGLTAALLTAAAASVTSVSALHDLDVAAVAGGAGDRDQALQPMGAGERAPQVHTVMARRQAGGPGRKTLMGPAAKTAVLSDCTAPAPPVADFTWSPQGPAPGFPYQEQPYVGQVVQFTDLSTNDPTAWSWYDFQGTGIHYSEQNPTHSWSTPGPKNVRMNSANCRDNSGEVLKAVTVFADSRPVTASFTWSPDPASPEVPITFTAMQGYEYGDPTEFTWTFITPYASETGAVVAHTFYCGGSFDVVLTARRGNYQQTIARTVEVGGVPCCPAPAKPVAAFTFSPQGAHPDYPEQLQPYVGQHIQLTDQSTNSPTSWYWYGAFRYVSYGGSHPVVAFDAPGTYTIELAAWNCKGYSPKVTQEITVYRDIRPVDIRLDFGTPTSPVEAGYTAVGPSVPWNPWGFGLWYSNGPPIDSRDRGSGTDLTRDFHFGVDGTFRVDVPTGIYDVTLTAGDAASLHDHVVVYLEGVQMDTVSTAKAEWTTRAYQVAVSNNWLNYDIGLDLRLIDLGGVDRFFAINALTVVSAPTMRFDFGVPGSPTAAGYVPIPNTASYSPATGFGWVAGSVGARDRAVGGDLGRDLNFSDDATFVVDVRNGEYDVTVRLGDAALGHDQMEVAIEDLSRDVVSTSAGQIEVRTYRTTVWDGQLTLRLRDLGGSDPNAAIVGLEVATVPPPDGSPDHRQVRRFLRR